MTRDFRLFWAGQVTTAFGSVFTTIAIPLIAVRHLGATPAQIGVLVAAGSVPLVLFGLLIATWVDRLPRRRPYLIGCELVAAAAVATVMLGLAAGHLTVWGLTAFVFVLGLVNVIVETAYFVHLRCLVGEGELVQARAQLQGGEEVGGVLGRVLSGPVLVVGAIVPFVIDLFSYLLSALCLVLIRTPEPRRPAARTGRMTRSELIAGFTLLRREPFLRGLTPLVVGQQVVGGVTLAVLAPFLLTVLDVPTSLYGVLFVLAGVAAVAGTAVTTRLARGTDARRLTLLGFVGMAVAAVLLPFADGSLALAASVAAVGIGLPRFFSAIGNIGLTAFLTAEVPEETLGRAGASLQLIAATSLVGGSVVGGLLAQQIGIRPTLWIAATLSVATLIALRPCFRAANPARSPTSAPPTAAAAQP